MNDRQQYVEEWAAKTGRPKSDIYVPQALQPEPVDPEMYGLILMGLCNGITYTEAMKVSRDRGHRSIQETLNEYLRKVAQQ